MEPDLSPNLNRAYVGYRSNEDAERERETSLLLPRASKNASYVLSFPVLDSWSGGPGKALVAYGYFLFICLGIAPQLLQNAMFSQTPIFIRETAEHKAITTHIIAAFMLANLFAVLYLVINSIKPIPDYFAMTTVFGVSILCSIACAFFWDKAIIIDGTRVSLPLLALAFVAGAVGNTSVLIFFGFASYYRELFTSALSAGFGLSGLLPSLLTFVQNTGADPPAQPVFGATIWFLLTAILIVIFSLSFCFIQPLTSLQDPEQVKARHERIYGIREVLGSSSGDSLFSYPKPMVHRIFELLALMTLSSVLTFWLPGAAPFLIETGPSLVWFNNMFLVLPTIGAFLAGLVQIYRVHRAVPWVCLIFQTLIFIYIILQALVATRVTFFVAEWLIFTLCFLFIVLGGYNTTMIYLLLRQDADYKLVQRTQRWAGFAFQLGGTIGIVINLALVHGGAYWQGDMNHGRQHHHSPATIAIPSAS